LPSDQDAQTISVARFAPQTLINERYEILSELGEGGMSVVYKARDTQLDEVVALKFLLASRLTHKKDFLRFRHEATVFRRLQHPGITKTTDLGVLEEQQPYLVMDFVAGETLATLIEREGQLPVKETVEIFCQICDALAYAHGHGVLHRDIKPSNIMVTCWDSPSMQAKLLDFGIAKLMHVPQTASQQLTETGEIVGSPAYMSPEQARNDKLDARSDLYSLGCSLYECLTGSPPHVGQTPLATILRRETDIPLALSEASLGKTFPRQLEAIVSKLLKTHPEDRYQSALELKSDLEKLESPATSEPAPTTMQQRKLVIPKPPTVFVISAAVLCLTIPFIWWASKQRIKKSVSPLPGSASPQVTKEMDSWWEQTAKDFAYDQIDSAEGYANRGDTQASDVRLRQAVSILDKVSPPDPKAKAAALSQLSINCMIRHEYKEAQKLCYQALALLEVADPDGLKRALVTKDLADIYFYLGDRKKAYQLCEESAVLTAKSCGDTSTRYCQTLTKAADVYMHAESIAKVRQTGKVKAIFDEVLSIADKNYSSPSNRSAVRHCLIQQAKYYQDHKLYPEAEERLNRALLLTGVPTAKEYHDIAVAKIDLARAYTGDHKFALGQSTFKSAITILERHDQSDDLKLGVAINGLGDAYYSDAHWNDLADPKIFLQAAATYQSALPHYEHTSPQPLPDLVSLHTKIGNSYENAALRKYASALPLAEASYRKALKLGKGSPGTQVPVMAGALLELGTICRLEGKYEEAKPYLAQALRLYQGSTGAETASVASTLSGMAENLRQEKKLPEALSLFKRSLAICNRLPLSQAARKAFTLKGMGDTYSDMGRFKEAKSSYLEARTLLQLPGPRRVQTIAGIDRAIADINKRAANAQKPSTQSATTGDGEI
jgi:serine/threonine protein kinase